MEVGLLLTKRSNFFISMKCYTCWDLVILGICQLKWLLCVKFWYVEDSENGNIHVHSFRLRLFKSTIPQRRSRHNTDTVSEFHA